MQEGRLFAGRISVYFRHAVPACGARRNAVLCPVEPAQIGHAFLRDAEVRDGYLVEFSGELGAEGRRRGHTIVKAPNFSPLGPGKVPIDGSHQIRQAGGRSSHQRGVSMVPTRQFQ